MLGFGLLGVGAALVGLLAVPIRLCLEAPVDGGPKFVRVEWLFGALRGRFEAGEGGRHARDKPPRRSSFRRIQGRQALAFLQTSGVAARLRSFLRAFIHSLRPQVEWARFELGLGDPAQTGQAWAALGPLSGWLMDRFDGRVRLEPNFFASVVAVQGHGCCTVVPIHSLGLVVGLVCSPCVWRGLRGARLARAR